jgi:multicomponent Na+:H+ antiporter subunit E
MACFLKERGGEARVNDKNDKGGRRALTLGGLPLAGALFVFWLLLTGRFGLRMMVTGILAVGITLGFYQRFLNYFNLDSVAATGFFRIMRFAVRVGQDIFVSAWTHMKRVVFGSPSPEMFTVTLSLEEPMLIALIANAITLTPGSMTVEVNGSELTVLAFVDGDEEVEAFRRQIHTRYEQVLGGGRSHA